MLARQIEKITANRIISRQGKIQIPQITKNLFHRNKKIKNSQDNHLNAGISGEECVSKIIKVS